MSVVTEHRTIGLVSVNVGLPAPLGSRRGKTVVSGIVKRPVTGPLFLEIENLEGDGQADLRVHGGPEKAVYAYPVEHLPRWNAELGMQFGPGTFGENLTTTGILEDDARIGDVWAWGEARLQICQPRSPCYKLALRTKRPDLLKAFIASGRTGWYFRVLEPGAVATDAPIHVVERDAAGLSILDAHRAMHEDGFPEETILALIAHPALAASWRDALAR